MIDVGSAVDKMDFLADIAYRNNVINSSKSLRSKIRMSRGLHSNKFGMSSDTQEFNKLLDIIDKVNTEDFVRTRLMNGNGTPIGRPNSC
jgi:hypothetical protein